MWLMAIRWHWDSSLTTTSCDVPTASSTGVTTALSYKYMECRNTTVVSARPSVAQPTVCRLFQNTFELLSFAVRRVVRYFCYVMRSVISQSAILQTLERCPPFSGRSFSVPVRISPNFPCILLYGRGSSPSGGFDRLCISGFADGMFSHYGRNGGMSPPQQRHCSVEHGTSSCSIVFVANCSRRRQAPRV